MIDKIALENRLQEQLDEVLSEGKVSDWFVIASNGSMNYGLDNENSDVDSKLLAIPSLEDLVFDNRQNYLHIMEDNGEHVEVKDIALYMKTILKQNINFVETLFAKCVIVNPKYRFFWNMLQEHREDIARYDERRACQCMLGMMRQKRKQMTEPSPGRQDSIDRIGYDAKSFHHLLRLEYFVYHYLDGKSYEDCLMKRDDDEHSILMAAKNGWYIFDIAKRIADWAIEDCDIRFDNHRFEDDNESKKKNIRRMIDSIVYCVIDASVMDGA